MRKLMLCLILGFCSALVSVKAQSKVFKEVSEDISSEMQSITQDGALVGYLAFTQLEKVNEDSFNYKITLMDENLNDIGTVSFREEKLDLEAVSFEQDVLCIAYLKSNINGREFKNNKEYNSFKSKNFMFTQFLTLYGKIIKTNEVKVHTAPAGAQPPGGKFTYYRGLAQHVQLKNISQKGFACFYGDADGCDLITYDLAGKELWQKNIDNEQDYNLFISKTDIYLLQGVNSRYYYLLSYNAEDGMAYDRIILNDKVSLNDRLGNELKVLSFGNDPVTGTAYLSGSIIDKQKGESINSRKELANGPYLGVFIMDIKGHTKNDVKQTFIYWNDGSQKPAISETGYIDETQSYSIISNSFRDYSSNTYFIGSEFIKKSKVTEVALLKLTSKGSLSFESEIVCDDSKFVKGTFSTNGIFVDPRGFYSVENANTKENFIIIDDAKNIVIYNVSKKKIVRTVPHKDGDTRTYILPAKEGHIMVVESNKKEKYTRLSIEALN